MILLVEEQLNLSKWTLQTETREQHAVTGKVEKMIRWTGSIFQLVELFYALHCMKCFNDGDISLTVLFATVCEMFSVKGTNFSQDFAEIRKRAGDRTIFLDCLKKELMKYMEQLDTK